MLKKSLIGLVVIAVLAGGYYKYSSFRKIQRIEQVRLREEALDRMMTTMIEADREARQAQEDEKQFYIERRKRIEAGTAKVELIEGTDSMGAKYQYTLIDGKEEGKYLSWYKNGRKKSEIFYRDNLRNGETLEYYDNEYNTLKSVRYYLNDWNVDEFFEWYEDGSVKAEGFISKDPKLDWGKGWYKNKQIKRNKAYDPETGSTYVQNYYEDGQLESAYFRKNNKFIGVYKSWYKTGKQHEEAHYDDRGQRNGWDYKWDEEGNIIQQNFYIDDYLSDPPVEKESN